MPVSLSHMLIIAVSTGEIKGRLLFPLRRIEWSERMTSASVRHPFKRRIHRNGET